MQFFSHSFLSYFFWFWFFIKLRFSIFLFNIFFSFSLSVAYDTANCYYFLYCGSIIPLEHTLKLNEFFFFLLLSFLLIALHRQESNCFEICPHFKHIHVHTYSHFFVCLCNLKVIKGYHDGCVVINNLINFKIRVYSIYRYTHTYNLSYLFVHMSIHTNCRIHTQKISKFQLFCGGWSHIF